MVLLDTVLVQVQVDHDADVIWWMRQSRGRGKKQVWSREESCGGSCKKDAESGMREGEHRVGMYEMAIG